MPSRIVCFWLEPTLDARVSFRRYVNGSDEGRRCPTKRRAYEGGEESVWGYHDAEVTVEERPHRTEDAGRAATPEDRADARWPKTCACGYAFAETDHWQVNVRTLYRSPQRALLSCVLRDAPVGAMWDAPWFKGHQGGQPRNPDGLYLVVRTPAGDWLIDGPANNGPGWSRTGVPPLVTATPSIGFGEPMRMHGWLKNGVLEIDLP